MQMPFRLIASAIMLHLMTAASMAENASRPLQLAQRGAQCGPCASARTHADCLKCAIGNGWPASQAASWCTRNMPACRKPR